jgi:arylsulfatase A-like enzyme
MCKFLHLSIIVLSFCIASCTGLGSSAQDYVRPNIIIILADDLGWADLSFRGHPIYETPHIDRLASEGIVLDNFYPSAANCAPSRAGILTGMYSPRHHVYLPQGYVREGNVENMRWKVPTYGEDSTFQTFKVNINHVDSAFTSLAEMLGNAGYISARLGKWHIGDDNQGFIYNSSGGRLGDFSNQNGTEGRYYNDTIVAERLTDTAIEIMEKHRDELFFIYLSHWEVHTPMAAKNDRISYYKKKIDSLGDEGFNAVYAAEVEQLDQSVGRISSKLEELGLSENTLVIFISDNGGLMSQTSNKPLRAGKGTFYEGGIRVPGIIRWPAVINPGKVSSTTVSGVDLMPTLAEIARTNLPPNQPVDGVSITPLFSDETMEERAVFFHYPLYLEGKGQEQVLPIFETQILNWRAVPSSTIIRGKWKLIKYYEYDSHELFDLSTDLSEGNDVSRKYPEVAAGLLEELEAWVTSTHAPVPSIPNPKFSKREQFISR